MAALHVLTPPAGPPQGDNSRAHRWAAFLQPLPTSFLALALPVQRGQDSGPRSSSFLVFPSGSLESSGPCPVHLGSPHPRRAPLPTWTAGVPAAPAGSRSALSARPGTAAASVPGCGPHPAGTSRTENGRISLGRGCLAAQSHPLVSVPSFQLLFLRLPRTTSILFPITVGLQPPNLPSMHQSNQHLLNCPAT